MKICETVKSFVANLIEGITTRILIKYFPFTLKNNIFKQLNM